MIDHGAVSFHLTYSFSVVCGGDETSVSPTVRVCRDILPLPVMTRSIIQNATQTICERGLHLRAGQKILCHNKDN